MSRAMSRGLTLGEVVAFVATRDDRLSGLVDTALLDRATAGVLLESDRPAFGGDASLLLLVLGAAPAPRGPALEPLAGPAAPRRTLPRTAVGDDAAPPPPLAVAAAAAEPLAPALRPLAVGPCCPVAPPHGGWMFGALAATPSLKASTPLALFALALALESSLSSSTAESTPARSKHVRSACASMRKDTCCVRSSASWSSNPQAQSMK